MEQPIQVTYPYNWLNRKVFQPLFRARIPVLTLAVLLLGLFLIVSLQAFLIYGVYHLGLVEDAAALGLNLERSLHDFLMKTWISKINPGFAWAWLGLFLCLCGMITGLVRKTTAVPPAEDQWAASLAAAARELRSRDALVTLQSKSFDALLSISEAAGENPCADTIFRSALEALRSATGFASIGIRMYDRDHHCFNLVAHYGIAPEMLAVLKSIPEGCGFQTEAFLTRGPVYTSDIPSDPRVCDRTPREQRYHSLICVPLIAGDRVLGTMELVSEQVHVWTEDEVRWLALFGRSLGTLIHNAELTNRLRDFCVLQERTRLAQEIHDGLAQLVGSLPSWAEEAQNCLLDEDYSSAQSALDKMGSAARDAYACIREELTGLRDAIAPDDDLFSVMSEYLGRFQRQWGIEAELVEDGNSRKALAALDPSAAIQVLRIFQESLSNVRRHSRATTVRITIGEVNDRVCITVQDNGTGFDPESVSGDHFGLRIMRERAESVGGTIRIASQIGCGTLLSIEMPGLK